MRLRPLSRYFHGGSIKPGFQLRIRSVTLQTRNTATLRVQPLIRFEGVGNDEQRGSEGWLHRVESAVLCNWRTQH